MAARNVASAIQYPLPASPSKCPHPPAFAVRTPFRPNTHAPVPLMTRMSAPAAARPDSKSLPTTARAFGNTCRINRRNRVRSAPVKQPARKRPTADGRQPTAILRSTARISRSALSLRFSEPSTTRRRILPASVASNATVLVPPPSMAKMIGWLVMPAQSSKSHFATKAH